MSKEIVVANIKRYALSPSGLVDKQRQAITIRKGAKVTEDYVKDINSRTNQRGNGKFAEIDKKATEKYYKECAEQNDKRRQDKEMKENVAKANLGNLLTGKK